MSLSTPILTTSSEIDTRVDDCSATAVVMKDDTDKAQMMSVFLIMDLLRKRAARHPHRTQKSNHRHRRLLLRARRERPCDCRAAEKRDEIAAFQTDASRAFDRKDSTPQNGRRLL